jgi:hypothetical protein
MSDAPERIWASVDPMYPEHHGGFWWGENCRGTEYRRADLPPTLAQAMQVPEVRELVDALVNRRRLYDRWEARNHADPLGPDGAVTLGEAIEVSDIRVDQALASIKGQME